MALIGLQGVGANMAATELLPKAWITEQWNQGYFITALAGIATKAMQLARSTRSDCMQRILSEPSSICELAGRQVQLSTRLEQEQVCQLRTGLHMFLVVRWGTAACSVQPCLVLLLLLGASKATLIVGRSFLKSLVWSAGSQDGQVLVVMTKLHRPPQQQSYKVRRPCCQNPAQCSALSTQAPSITNTAPHNSLTPAHVASNTSYTSPSFATLSDLRCVTLLFCSPLGGTGHSPSCATEPPVPPVLLKLHATSARTTMTA